MMEPNTRWDWVAVVGFMLMASISTAIVILTFIVAIHFILKLW